MSVPGTPNSSEGDQPLPAAERNDQQLVTPPAENRPPKEPDLESLVRREPSRLKRILLILGPGLISGASNNDPSAIATYAKAGAAFGFVLLFMAPALFPMMACSVYLSAKIGLLTGKGLAGMMREYYPRWLLYPLVIALVVANTIGAGADIGAIAEGVRLFVPRVSARVLIVPIALGILALQVFASYRGLARTFKWLTIALFGFVISGVLARPPLIEVLKSSFVPRLRFDEPYVSTLVAMFGTALSPYLYFWQASQRVEEKVAMGRYRLWQRRGASGDELKYAAIDVNSGMLFACVIVYFIILATAATVHATGGKDIQSAAQAALALAPALGTAAAYVFALAFIGAGLLAIPVLTTGAAYAVCEAWAWAYGLAQTPRSAPHFYGVICASTVAGMLLNFSGINPITALFYAGIVNGILVPPLLVVLLLATNNTAIVGTKHNSIWVNLLGWLTVAATAAAVVVFAVMGLR